MAKEKYQYKYSVRIGLWKSIKNVLITVGIPGVLYLVNNAAEWMPPETYLKCAPVIALIAYFVKNFLQNK